MTIIKQAETLNLTVYEAREVTKADKSPNNGQ